MWLRVSRFSVFTNPLSSRQDAVNERQISRPFKRCHRSDTSEVLAHGVQVVPTWLGVRVTVTVTVTVTVAKLKGKGKAKRQRQGKKAKTKTNIGGKERNKKEGEGEEKIWAFRQWHFF